MSTQECVKKIEELIEQINGLLKMMGTSPILGESARSKLEENVYAMASYKMGEILAEYFNVAQK